MAPHIEVTTRESAERLELGGSSVLRLATADQTGGAWALVESCEQPGLSPGLHRHHGEFEVFFIVEGDYAFSGSSATFRAGVGDTVVVPPDTPHDFTTGPAGGRTLCLLPGCYDGYFSAVQDVRTGRGPELDVAALDEEHCVERLGPGDDVGEQSAGPVIIPAAAGEDLWFQGWLTTIKLDGSQTGGSLSLFDCLADKGPATPRHQDTKTQAFVILEGSMTFWSDEKVLDVPAGAVVVVPPVVPFAFRVESATRLLVIASPSGLEEFFRQAGEPALERRLPGTSVAHPDRATLAAAAQAGGITVTGPPPT